MLSSNSLDEASRCGVDFSGGVGEDLCRAILSSLLESCAAETGGGVDLFGFSTCSSSCCNVVLGGGVDFFESGEGLLTVGGLEGFPGFSSTVLLDVTSGVGADFTEGSFRGVSSSVSFSTAASGGGVTFFRTGEGLSDFLSSSSVGIVASGDGVPFSENLPSVGDLLRLSTSSGLSSSASLETGVDLFGGEGLFTGGGLEGRFAGAVLCGFASSSLGIVASEAEERG